MAGSRDMQLSSTTVAAHVVPKQRQNSGELKDAVAVGQYEPKSRWRKALDKVKPNSKSSECHTTAATPDLLNVWQGCACDAIRFCCTCCCRCVSEPGDAVVVSCGVRR